MEGTGGVADTGVVRVLQFHDEPGDVTEGKRPLGIGTRPSILEGKPVYRPRPAGFWCSIALLGAAVLAGVAAFWTWVYAPDKLRDLLKVFK
jgi:hypothetical protein